MGMAIERGTPKSPGRHMWDVHRAKRERHGCFAARGAGTERCDSRTWPRRLLALAQTCLHVPLHQLHHLNPSLQPVAPRSVAPSPSPQAIALAPPKPSPRPHHSNPLTQFITPTHFLGPKPLPWLHHANPSPQLHHRALPSPPHSRAHAAPARCRHFTPRCFHFKRT